MSALDIIKFIKPRLHNYCIGGDIDFLNNYKIRTCKDVERWLQTVKDMIGPRNYKNLKRDFEYSQRLDMGFKEIDIYETDLSFLDYLIELQTD